MNKNIKLIIMSFVSLLYFCSNLDKTSEWDNPLDPNGDNYFPPSVNAMANKDVVVNDTIEFFASSYDSNGTVEKLIWSFDLGESWIDTISPDSTNKKVFSSSKSGPNIVLVSAIDNDGIVSDYDSTIITVDLAPPIIDLTPNLLVSQDSVVEMSISVNDKNEDGILQKYYLDIGLNGWDDSSNVNLFNLNKAGGGNETYCVAVRDDDSNMVYDTFAIRYNRPPTKLNIKDFNSGDTIYYKNVNLLDLNGSISLVLDASDPDSSLDTLTYKFYIWLNDADPSLVYEGTQKNVHLNNLKMAEKYKYKLVVSDVYGDSLVEKGFFYTEVIDLVNPEITLMGDNPLNLPKGFVYRELGYNGYDEIDGDITDSVEISGDFVNTTQIGSYEVVYSLKDDAGNDTSVIRLVNINEYISLENFSGGKSWQTTFGSLFNDEDSTGYWKGWSDVYDGGNTSILPDLNLGTDSAFKNNHVKNIGTDGGDALNINVSIGEDAYYPYWGIGFFIRDRGEYYDLSGLDSLVFYVKGSIASDSGSYRVQFTYQALDTLWEDSKWGYAGKALTCTNQWQRIVLTPSDFTGVEGSPGEGHTWNMIKYGINMIQFCEQPGEDEIPDVELFIDDIRLYGDFSGSGLFE